MRIKWIIPHFVIAILFLLLYLFSFQASAELYYGILCTDSSNRTCSQGEAFAQVNNTSNPAKISAAIVSATLKNFTASAGYYGATYAVRDRYGGISDLRIAYYYGQSCLSTPSKISKFYPPTGSIGCNLGCEVKYRQNGDDETTTVSTTGKACNKAPDCAAQDVNMVWNSYLGVCQPVAPECEAGFKLVGNSCVEEKPCPDGMALQNGVCKAKENECPAGSTLMPDGSCKKAQCPDGQTMGDDGTCKKPKPEDSPDNCPAGQKADENGKCQFDTSFSGGDTCDVPPSCSGDPVMCGQARIQWRIDCNTRKNTNVSGGPCSPSGMPVCTGEKCDQVEYSQLIMQWRSACAAEKLLEKSNDTQGDNTGTTPTPDTSGVSDGELSGQAPNDGDATGAFSDGSNAGNGSGSGNGSGNGNGLNSSGYGWSRSCPTPPTVNLMGQAITFNVGPFCNWMVLGGWLVLLFSALLSLRILSSSSNS